MLLASSAVWMIGYVDTFIASFFDTGSISYLSYCRRVINNTSVISSSVCLVYYPILSNLTQEGDDSKFQETFLKGIHTVFTLTVIITAFILIYAEPIVTILFERGAFSANDTDNVVHILKYFSYVLIGGPFGAFLANLYYAKRRMKLVNILSVFSSVVNLILDCILGYFYGIIGLALASSIAFFVGNMLFLIYLSRITRGYKFNHVIRKIIPPLIVGMLTFFIVIYLKRFGLQFEHIQYFYIKIFYLIIHFLIYFLVFIILALIFQIEIISEFIKKGLNKIKFP
jgi:putative peptidoglycan lipid II flippase